MKISWLALLLSLIGGLLISQFTYQYLITYLLVGFLFALIHRRISSGEASLGTFLIGGFLASATCTILSFFTFGLPGFVRLELTDLFNPFSLITIFNTAFRNGMIGIAGSVIGVIGGRIGEAVLSTK